MDEDDELPDTPGVVIGAVAAGTGALPFLAVYATIFIVHGGFHHVVPPDVTQSNRGELIAGLICLAIFVAAVFGIVWLLNARRRWPFVVVQAGLFVIAVDFFVDPTKGGRVVSGLVIVTTAVAVVLSLHRDTWRHLGRTPPAALGSLFGRRRDTEEAA